MDTIMCKISRLRPAAITWQLQLNEAGMEYACGKLKCGASSYSFEFHFGYDVSHAVREELLAFSSNSFPLKFMAVNCAGRVGQLIWTSAAATTRRDVP